MFGQCHNLQHIVAQILYIRYHTLFKLFVASHGLPLGSHAHMAFVYKQCLVCQRYSLVAMPVEGAVGHIHPAHKSLGIGILCGIIHKGRYVHAVALRPFYIEHHLGIGKVGIGNGRLPHPSAKPLQRITTRLPIGKTTRKIDLEGTRKPIAEIPYFAGRVVMKTHLEVPTRIMVKTAVIPFDTVFPVNISLMTGSYLVRNRLQPWVVVYYLHSSVYKNKHSLHETQNNLDIIQKKSVTLRLI